MLEYELDKWVGVYINYYYYYYCYYYENKSASSCADVNTDEWRLISFLL